MAKKKQKPKKITLAGGQAIEQRPDRPGRPPGRIVEPADSVVLDARMRRMAKPDKPAARAQLAGTDMGLCIMHSREDQSRLWAAWQAVCSARLTYRMRILGTTGQPQGAALAMIPEPMQTDQSHSVDLRTAEERDIAAKRGDEYWASLIAALPAPQYKRALMPAMDETEGALWRVPGIDMEEAASGVRMYYWRDAAPTKRGLTVVQALVLLAAMHEGVK